MTHIVVATYTATNNVAPGRANNPTFAEDTDPMTNICEVVRLFESHL